MSVVFSEEYQEHYRAIERLNKLFVDGLLTEDETADAMIPHILAMAKMREIDLFEEE